MDWCWVLVVSSATTAKNATHAGRVVALTVSHNTSIITHRSPSDMLPVELVLNLMIT